MTASYVSIGQPAEAEIVERKSRFIGHVAPVVSEEDAFDVLQTIREQHPEARHHVWAYLLQNGRERCSDDGEPQKTAGLPTLEVLRRSGLVNIMLVTTRYFGGVLLGTGGLVRAYTQVAQEALAVAERTEYTMCLLVRCRLPYALYEQVSHLARECGGKIQDTVFTEVVELPVLFKQGDQELFEQTLRELMRGETCWIEEPPSFCAF